MAWFLSTNSSVVDFSVKKNPTVQYFVCRLILMCIICDHTDITYQVYYYSYQLLCPTKMIID